MVPARTIWLFSALFLLGAHPACSSRTHTKTTYHRHEEHRHHHHGFDDAEKWARHFENPERDKWQKPQAVIAMLDLAEDARVADIGAATGYFAVRIAARVPRGRVWGVDIEPDMVRFLNGRARKESVHNLFAVLGTPESPLLPEPVDVILMVNTYHHIGKRQTYFHNLRESLRPGGRLVVVDFKPGDLPIGPSDKMKVRPEAMQAELDSAGYRIEKKDMETLPYQFVLIATPPSS